jgi:hypothetical protein
MTEPAQATTETTATASTDADLTSLLGDLMAPDAPAPAAATTTVDPAKPPPAEADPVDPLAEELYAESVLQTPEQARKAAELLRAERAKLAELRKKAMRDHGSAENRERKVKAREQAIKEAEARVAAWERTASANQSDLESGDAERFLTAVARMSKSADPASFWKKASMKLASGGTFTEAEKRQAQADPETQRKLAELEQIVRQGQEREAQVQAEREAAYIEHLKTQNLTFAQKSDAHPYVKLYATEQPENIREALAEIMVTTHEQTGQPIDIATACGKLEASLKAQYELSQRVGGNTNGEKGTTGLEPGAGQETSGQPPKPETATRAPATVPASLTATQGNAQRALTPREQRTQQVQSLPQEFWNQFGL